MHGKSLAVAFFVLLMSSSKAQDIPPFNPQPFKLYVPAFLPGIMEDGSATLRNDTLVYDLVGQVFSGGYKIVRGGVYGSLLTPWHTLYAMTDAYAKRNKQAIINLYATASKNKIRQVVNGPQAPKFFEVVSRAAPKLRLLAGINYQQGFAVYTEDDEYGLHENYLIREGTAYRLSALKDGSPTGWNIASYFRFKPAPLLPVQNVSLPDSINVEDSATVSFTVPEPGRWAGLSLGELGPLLLLAQDNGLNDFDPAAGRVTVHLKGSMFFTTGSYEFYIYSLNFPVQRVSLNFIKSEGKHVIKITE